MDEIGRGTSTYDGLALADACARHLAAINRSYTLFATHYFELTALAEPGSGIANVHLDEVEHRAQEGSVSLVFMHSVKDGPADRSFGRKGRASCRDRESQSDKVSGVPLRYNKTHLPKYITHL